MAKKMSLHRWCLLGLAALMLLASCGEPTAIPPGPEVTPSSTSGRVQIHTAMPSKTPTSTRKPKPPTATPTTTLNPTKVGVRPTVTLIPTVTPAPILGIGALTKTGEIDSKIIIDAVWSPDGSRLALETYGGVELYDSSYRKLHTFEDLVAEDPVLFSPSGRIIGIPSSGSLYLFDTRTYQSVSEGSYFYTDQGYLTSDDQLITLKHVCANMAGDCDSWIEGFRISTLSETFRFPERFNRSSLYISSIAVSSDETQVAAAFDDLNIYIYDLETQQTTITLTGHTGVIRSMDFSPDGLWLATAGDDATLRLWNVIDGRLLNTAQGFSNKIENVSFSSDGTNIYVKVFGETGIQIRTTRYGILHDVVSDPPGRVLAIKQDGSQYLTTDDYNLRILNTSDRSLAIQLSGYRIEADNLVISPNGVYFAVVNSYNPEVRQGYAKFQVWNLKENRLLASANLPDVISWPNMNMAFSPDSETLSMTSTQGLYLWNWKDSEPELIGQGRPNITIFSPDGQYVAAAGADYIAIWNAASRKAQFHQKQFWGEAKDLLFSADGKSVAFLWDKVALVVQSDTGTPLYQTYTPEEEKLLAATFYKTDRFILTSLRVVDDVPYLLMDAWTADGRGRIASLIVDDAFPEIVFSPDGQLTLLISNGFISILSTSTGNLLYKSAYQDWNDYSTFDFRDDNTTLYTSKGQGLPHLEMFSLTDIVSAANNLLPAWETRELQSVNLLPQSLAQPIDGLSVQTPPEPTAGAILPENTAAITETLSIGRGAANQVAWSPDGSQYAVASSSGVYVYNTDDHSDASFYQSDAPTISVCWSSNNRFLAAGDEKGQVLVWEISSGQVILRAQSIIKVSGIAFSPDNERLALPYGEGVLAIINVSTGRVEREISGFGTPYYGSSKIIFSADGRSIYATDGRGNARSWDLQTGEITNNLTIRQNETLNIWDFDLSTDGKYLATGHDNANIYLWNLKTDEIVFSQTLQTADPWYYLRGVFSVAISADQKMVAAGSDKEINIYDSTNGEQLHHLDVDPGKMAQMVFSPDGSKLFTLDENNVLKLWDAKHGTLIRNIIEHSGSLYSLDISASGEIHATYGDVGLIYDPQTGKINWSGSGLGGDWMAISKDAEWAAIYNRTVNYTGGMQIWDLRKSEMVYELEGPPNDGPSAARGSFEQALFNSDRSYLISTGDYTLRIWDLTKGTLLNQDGGDLPRFTCTPTFSMCLFTDYYGSLVWIRPNVRSIDLRTDVFFQGAAFHPDGIRVAYGYANLVRFINLSTGEIQQSEPIDGHFDPIFAYSPDGSLLVAGSKSGDLFFFDAETLELRAKIHSHESPIAKVVFSPDGTFLVTSGEDGIIKVWRVP